MGVSRETMLVGLRAVGIAVAIPVFVYLAALAVNFRDQPPSREALALAADEPVSQSIRDEDNAYVYLLGFGAPRESDAVAAGAARAAWIRKMRDDPSLGIETDPGPKGLPDLAQLYEPVRELSCAIDGGAACFDALSGARDTIERTTSEQAWLLDRYRTLLSYGQWADVTSEDVRALVPDYPSILQGRRLYYLHAWTLAISGDAEGVRAALDADLDLWRLSLRDTSTVLSKMIAAGFVREHFAWGTLILRRLPPPQRAAAIPGSWRRPLSVEERSMERAFRGEWKFARNAMRDLAGERRRPSPPKTDGSSLRVFLDRIDHALPTPFLKVQATLNDHAAALVRVESLLDVPYAELPAALARAPDIVNEKTSGIVDATYNAVGRKVISFGREELPKYGVRVADLEGVRRAALLTAELRARDVPVAALPAALELDAARDPYTGQAFIWIPERSAIAFVGLQSDSRGHVEFLY
jgi:hypothetical protein